MGVHTHDYKIKKKLWKKLDISVFSTKSFEKHCYQWEYRMPMLKKKNSFQSILFGYREIFSRKPYFEWFGKNYQRGYSGIM